ncbi:MAG: tetratricopeptide repeat protein, partial [Flavobacteriales bacterium]|nr:tetratricopeptide repeat protein [Flavobacteriales bacterium]
MQLITFSHTCRGKFRFAALPTKNAGLTALILLTCLSIFAQKPATYLKPGDKARDAGDWTLAYTCYEQAFLLDSADFEIGWRYAEAARHIKYYDLAGRLYEKLYDKDKGRIHPEGLFWLAAMQKLQGRYEDAQRNFRKFQKKHKKADKQLIDRAAQEEKSAVWALGYKENDDVLESVYADLLKPVIPENCRFEKLIPLELRGSVNTAASETSPSIHRGNFYFSRHTDNASGWNLHRATMDTSAHPPEFFNMPAEATIYNDGSGLQRAHSVWADETMWYTELDEAGMRLKSDPAVPIPFPVMDGYLSMPATLRTSTGWRLYFVSDRAGGYGGLDIWYCDLNNGTWSKAVNAGDVVNTPGDEISPFAIANCLFFSSDWHEGFGGQDVFCAKDLGGVFDKPFNMGKTINSSLQDMFFWTDPTLGYYFFSSNREGATGTSEGVYCCNDLYGGRIETNCSEKPADQLEALMNELPVRLYFHNDEPNPDSWDTTSAVNYSDAFDSYIGKIPTYEKENSKGL